MRRVPPRPFDEKRGVVDRMTLCVNAPGPSPRHSPDAPRDASGLFRMDSERPSEAPESLSAGRWWARLLALLGSGTASAGDLGTVPSHRWCGALAASLRSPLMHPRFSAPRLSAIGG